MGNINVRMSQVNDLISPEVFSESALSEQLQPSRNEPTRQETPQVNYESMSETGLTSDRALEAESSSSEEMLPDTDNSSDTEESTTSARLAGTSQNLEDPLQIAGKGRLLYRIPECQGFTKGFAPQFQRYPDPTRCPDEYSPQKGTPLFKLPPELILHIFRQCPLAASKALSRTCKRLHEILRTETPEGHVEIDMPRVCTCNPTYNTNNTSRHLWQRLCQTEEIKNDLPIRSLQINLYSEKWNYIGSDTGWTIHSSAFLPLQRLKPEDKAAFSGDPSHLCGLDYDDEGNPLTDYWEDLNADFHGVRDHLVNVKIRIQMEESEESQGTIDYLEKNLDNIIDLLCRNCCGEQSKRINVQILLVGPRHTRLIANSYTHRMGAKSRMLAETASYMWNPTEPIQNDRARLSLSLKFDKQARFDNEYGCDNYSLHPHPDSICHYQSWVVVHRHSDELQAYPKSWKRLPIDFLVVENTFRTPLAYVEIEGVRATGHCYYKLLKQLLYDRGTLMIKNCSIKGLSKRFPEWKLIFETAKEDQKGGHLRYCELEQLAEVSFNDKKVDGAERFHDKEKTDEWEKLLMSR